jgi:hypothetical protein
MKDRFLSCSSCPDVDLDGGVPTITLDDNNNNITSDVSIINSLFLSDNAERI